ncbi:pentatricopeptide repeat-containing protein At4g02820, mitochondrial [Phragmites australis]|uniref:pentatricopeptide repeat-containing protein At4g02820, mitochondrial n=1 Tax=Phragmites australis TaxID=29695 RepID=UPI002D791D9C|nr:pentatricopeptide repeat-containing protein At4g02820, mitochondrial [Phragmites australis]
MLARRLAPPAAARLLSTAAPVTSSVGGGGGGAGPASGRGDTLGKRLLKLIYPKRSAVVVLRRWAEEGRTVQKYQLNRVVRELRKYGRFKHALEICEWMRTQPEMRLLPGDHAVHLDLVAKVRGLASAEKFFEDMPERAKAPSTCNALLHTYVQHGARDKAEAMLAEMAEAGYLTCALPFNHMMSLYMVSGELERVPEMIKELRRYTVPDLVTYNIWLTYCSKKNSVKSAEKVFDLMMGDKVVPDWMTFSMLASIYINAGLHVKGRDALVEMEKRASRKERAAYSSLLTLYANLSDRGNLDRVWNTMREIFRKFSDTEYKCMLTSLTRFGDITAAESVYREWESASGTRDSRIPNTILSYYIKNCMIQKAESFLDHIVQKGVKPSYSTWELFVWGYLSHDRMDKVFECLKNALSSLQKWEPNHQLATTIFSEVEKTGDIEDAEKFLVMFRDAGYVTTEIYNSVLRTYAKAELMPLIIDERMEQDKVAMDEETRRLLRLTSNYPIGEVSTLMP